MLSVLVALAVFISSLPFSQKGRQMVVSETEPYNSGTMFPTQDCGLVPVDLNMLRIRPYSEQVSHLHPSSQIVQPLQ